MFTESFDEYAIPGESISTEEEGFTIIAMIHHDEDMGPPWEEHDGHGPVSEWRMKNTKRPGERILVADRDVCRFYDIQEAIRIAKRDGWDTKPVPFQQQGTPGERAARTVEADFQAMQAWCNNEWSWCYIALSVSKNGVTLDDHAACLCGIDLNYPGSDNSYLTEVANELLPQAIEAGKAVMAMLVG